MKITLHPLFLLAGLFTAIFGGLPVFLIYALTALLHECGHIFCAYRLGYSCERVSLMPYGAAAYCNTEGISAADEIKLALAGPLVNAAIAVACAGLWWFFPETYAYTDTVFSANAVMLVINVLPAYPLDGGRVVRCLIVKVLPKKTVNIAMRVATVLVAVGVVMIFVFVERNISVLTFAGFLLVSAFMKDGTLTRINFTAHRPKRGREVKIVMLNQDSTYRDALRHLEASKYLILQFYLDGMIDEICEDELFELLQTHGLYDKIQQ